MQSYLQYRRIQQSVRRQVEPINSTRNGEIPASGSTFPPPPPPPSSPSSPSAILPGVRPSDDGQLLIVGWEDENDPLNPRNYGLARRLAATLIVTAMAFVVTAASSISSAVVPQTDAAYHVSDVVGSLTTGIYLLGFATGSLVSGPLSEILGRNAVYSGSLVIFMLFVMASGLAPNIGAQLACRFLAGVFGCPPLTCAGGTVADLWSPLEKTFAFPLYSIVSFGGPVLAPVIASYMGGKVLSWRWTDWIILIMSGLILALILLFQPETYSPLLLRWKAKHLRTVTGDSRYHSPMDMQHADLLPRIWGALDRQFRLTVHEPIILLIALYMTVIYIVLFTFFDGYTFIFTDVHHLSQGLTNVVWVAMYLGILLGGTLIPLIYKWTKAEFLAVRATTGEGDPAATEQPGSHVFDHVHTRPENRLWFAMFGAPCIPIALFWMGWTDWANVSIWSPIIASAFFGFGTVMVFISSYMYVIDTYDIYAASALGFMTVSRYSVAGGMTVAGVPFYTNLGVHHTLTILACISAVMTPLPYVFYRYGEVIRGLSKFARKEKQLAA
ncbi:hypothetical protein ASPZODRAFT_150016 [Penicilliopsis zonata CBS 506.65]|uniref:Major facilitator superfamily (MFS) profile domain-containing protein n=1 Tax=Penicilliopsis zonata CBS 506.65 TaxID=1073090 RepID=A0A1L9SP84_9EURO|nr:hypothetical protein ASPZODRAFT_150016 [Penicilliopsis zonata CBS 506.65]OJJ49062.1 hypothetical protein ASPZODRAFT_150016 [Penicilliopsis zonata CBS 506.65]